MIWIGAIQASIRPGQVIRPREETYELLKVALATERGKVCIAVTPAIGGVGHEFESMRAMMKYWFPEILQIMIARGDAARESCS